MDACRQRGHLITRNACLGHGGENKEDRDDFTMAFTLQIRQKKLFGKTALDIPSLARACGLNYGSNNDFYILQENEQVQGTAVFYNPERIGRGIFFDGSKAKEGYYELSYNIPTTEAEITDFARLAGEIERRLIHRSISGITAICILM